MNNIRFHNWYYPLVLLSYVLALYFPAVFRPGMASAFFVCLVFAEVALHAISVKSDGEPHGFNLNSFLDSIPTEDSVMAIWLLYNILSGIWCIAYGTPAHVFIGELFTTALPMVFYFCGRNDIREGGSGRFNRTFLFSVAVIGLIGIVLFAAAPKYYVDYIKDLGLISKADVSTMRVRMHSVIGSTLMGFLPSIGMLVSVRCFLDTEGRKSAGLPTVSQGSACEYNLIKRDKILSVLSFFFMLFLAFMSNQRSAMAAAIIIIIYLNILVFFVYRILPKKFFVLECLAAIFGIAAFFFIFKGAFMKVYYRLVSLPGAIAQRSDQWVGAANNMCSIWLGNGLGANGHRAIGITEHLIADGGLAKLYVESGIAGTSIFIFLILLLSGKAKNELKLTAPEFGIALIVLLMSIGSNMMSFALSVPVFYYYLGTLSGLESVKRTHAEGGG